jgi:FkbM family methyltransferase
MRMVKSAGFKVLTFLFKHTVGRGLGKIPFTRSIYDYLYRSLVVKELTLNVHGSKMITRVSNDDGVSYQLLFYRSGLEQYETKLFKKLVTKGMTVIDVGANIGYYTLLSARLVGNNGKVYAFEPEPQNYALLVRNIELNDYKNVIPVNQAVSNKMGKAALFLNREAGAHGMLPDRENIIGVTTVETVNLDEYFKGREYPLDIIKIDVEGAELAVLKGMPNIIRKNDNLKIFTELFWPEGLQKSRFSPRQYWDKLVESGFKFIYLINDAEQRLELTDLSSLVRYGEGRSIAKLSSPNLLCVKIPLKLDSQ